MYGKFLSKIMNREAEIINKIRGLNEIKPDADWVVLAKARIIGEIGIKQEQSFATLLKNFVFQYRIAVAGLLMAGFAGGTVALAQNALPGEPLYSLKKATEKGIAFVSSRDDAPTANLQLAAKRLEEIGLVSQKNLVKNLPAAFKEYKDAKATAKKEVAALVKQNPELAGAIVKGVAPAMKDIDNRERQVYGVLGVEENAAGDDISEAASDKTIVESLIDYFKKGAVLTGEQTDDLTKVKELYEAGNYGEAVSYYLNSSLNK